jgi:hypothetical protein
MREGPNGKAFMKSAKALASVEVVVSGETAREKWHGTSDEPRSILDNPLAKAQIPLVLRWSPNQLEPVLNKIGPLLPVGTPDKMLSAIASVVRSVVVAFKLTGQGVYYSRRKNAYPKKRYADRYYSFHYVTKAMDQLEELGLVTNDIGQWKKSANPGWRSVAVATNELLDLAGDLVDPNEDRGEESQFESIVLRDSDDLDDDAKAVLIDHLATAEVAAMRKDANWINTNLAKLEVWVGSGDKLQTPCGHRVFNKSFERNGRFYLVGKSVQNILRHHRAKVRLMIGGQLVETVELDYKSIHPTMAYTEMGLSIPEGDLYEIDSYDRDVVKRAFLIMFNAGDREGSVKALAHHLRTHREHRQLCGIACASGDLPKQTAEYLVMAIEERHEPIKTMFNSDCGARFMRKDSDIAVEVMLQMIEKTGRCPLPIHDSFLVVREDQELLHQTMLEVATNHGLILQVEVKGQ